MDAASRRSPNSLAVDASPMYGQISLSRASRTMTCPSPSITPTSNVASPNMVSTGLGSFPFPAAIGLHQIERLFVHHRLGREGSALAHGEALGVAGRGENEQDRAAAALLRDHHFPDPATAIVHCLAP